MSHIVNIGLKVGNESKVRLDYAIATLHELGLIVLKSEVRGSNTEPTLVAELQYPVAEAEANQICYRLRQEAIAQLSDGVGELYGPRADEWRPFDPDRFLLPS